MDQTLPPLFSPREETLQFIRAFARAYNPDEDFFEEAPADMAPFGQMGVS
ncbi:MAG: hypothetical protein IKR63_07120 [Alloprevotella sp.]|nr:hypothetical protein [Alloprevotella sp.]